MWKIAIGMLAFVLACISGVYARDDERTFKSKALAHYIMAVSYDLNGQSRRAISEYQRSISLDPNQPLPHLRLAAYDVRSGLLDRAVGKLKTVLALDPENDKAHYLLALVYSSQKKYDLAAKEYEDVLKSASQDEPENLEIHIYLAQLYFSQGKYSQAIVEFNHILKIQPDNVSANYLLGSSCLELQQRAEARARFQKVLVLEPNHDGALNSLAYMYAEESVNLDDALKMVEQATTIDPSNGAYLDTLGWVLFKKGMNSQALLTLQKAEAVLQDPIIYDHMGDVYKSIGEFALARKFWRKALELDPQQPQIHAKLEELEKQQAFQSSPETHAFH